MLLTKGDYISITDFKAQAPEVDVSQYTDATLSGFITSASRQIDRWLNIPASLTIEHIADEKSESHIDADGNLIVWPKKIPIVTISGISIVKGTDTIDLDLENTAGNPRWDIIDDTQIAYPQQALAMTSVSIIGSFGSIAQTRFYTELDYQAGFQDIPEDIQDATVLWVRDMVGTRPANPTGASEIRQGGVAIKYGSGVRTTEAHDSDMIRDAKERLRPYKRVSGW